MQVTTSRTIAEITVESSGRLLVRPSLPLGEDYAYIYRDGTGIEWEPELRALVAREPSRWAHVSLFQKMVVAVHGEYGESLDFSNETKWTNVDGDLQAELIAAQSFAGDEKAQHVV